MDAQQLIKLTIVGSVVLVVLSIGMQAHASDALRFVRQPLLALKAALAMYLLVPLIAWAASSLLDLEAPVPAALMALSVAAMPPVLPRKETKAGADHDYIIALQLFAALASLIAAPIALWLAAPIIGSVDVWSDTGIVRTLLVTTFAPLLAGMVAARVAPGWAERIAPLLARVGMLLLVLAGGVALFGLWPSIQQVLNPKLVLAISIIALLAMAAGYALGGPERENRGALALASAARHPGMAIALLGAVPTASTSAVAIVVVALAVNLVLAIPLVRYQRALGS